MARKKVTYKKEKYLKILNKVLVVASLGVVALDMFLKNSNSKKKKSVRVFNQFLIVTIAVVAIVSLAGIVKAITTVNLGTADSFAVLAGSGITNTGATTINGDVGSYPTTSQTGFGTVTITGTNHAGDGVTQGAKTDLVTAYNNAASQGPTNPIVADLGGQTLIAGIYNSASSIGLTGAVTLNAEGDPNAIFIFQAGSTLTTASASSVLLTNGAQACNVFWQIGSSATLGTTSNFKGSILALDSITDDGGSVVAGRFLARNAAVTLNNTTIIRPACIASAASSASSSSGSGSSEQVPNINVTKVPNPLSLPDGPGSVTYTYRVTNTGDLPLSDVVLTDNKCSTVTFLSGDRNQDSMLDLDEIWTYRCTQTVSNTVTNIATVNGFANGVAVRDTAQATVPVGAVPPNVNSPGLPNTGIDPESKTSPYSQYFVCLKFLYSLLLQP